MCSVFDCDSWRRNAQRFALPEDTDRRLKWVQFLFEVNEQRLKESSCADITICIEHFDEDCYFKAFPAGTVRLMSGAVPSLRVKVEQKALKEDQESLEDTELEDCDNRSLDPDDSEQISVAAPASPVPSDSSEALVSEYCQTLQQVRNLEMIRDKVGLLQVQGNYVVNQKQLLQLFSPKCASCGTKVKVEKLTFGVLIVLNQHCLQCGYRKQWKSQVNASVPENRLESGGEDVTSQIKEIVSIDRNNSSVTGMSEAAASFDEDSDPMEEMEESGEEGCGDSDEDWTPMDDLLLYQSCGDTEESDFDDDPLIPRDGRLCTDCGKFYNIRKPHMCEHILKPYSCNICGKRCVSESALSAHSRIHDENYQHHCKYCYVAFKAKVDKVNHEQTHLNQEKPYKCPDCLETFATHTERKKHLERHRGPPQLKCNICHLEFKSRNPLKRHYIVHTGAKPFKCSICQRGFSQASHLKSHVRLHTGERPFKCQHCDKSFNHNLSLKNHIQKYHTGNSGRELKHAAGEMGSSVYDAEGGGADSQPDDAEREQECNVSVVKRTTVPIFKRKSTGRPLGRPKRGALDSSLLAVQVEGQFLHPETGTEGSMAYQ